MSYHAGRAHFTYFSQLERWTPLRNAIEQGDEAASWTPVTIGDLVTEVESRVTVAPDAEYGMAGVKWYAEGVFHRETVFGRDMSAKYVTPLQPGALIYNRLFAWKASFAIVQPEHEGLFVSNEFPQFEIDASKALPEFLYLFCTIPATIKQVNAASAGSAAVSRNRFKESEFLKFKLRLPPLATQKAIVGHWRATQERTASVLKAADAHEAEVESSFLNSLGLKRVALPSTQRGFALRWTDMQRWGVDGLRKTIGGIDPTKGKFAAEPLGTVLEFAQYGTSEKANELEQGIPVLRIGNIKEGEISWDNLKHIELAAKTETSLRLVDGDILIIRTSGSRDLVGTCGVYRGDRLAVFASYLIRLRVDQTKALPEFISYFVNSPAGRQQVDAVSRQIMQNNINSEEIKGLRIPLPPLSTQKKLAAEVTAARAKIAAGRAAAARLAAETAVEVEEMILGKRPAPEA